ncbi:MAG: radical SAM protein [Sporomusaceae bacterium]|nr:radical SAM protein [Sporomusaceae bacterium]
MAELNRKVVFAYPNQTKAITLTGSRCDLKCSHCGGHYLQGMKPVTAIAAEKQRGARSFLVSGGCLADGRVPFGDSLELLAELKQDVRYNLHVGLIADDEIEKVAALADTVSFDFVGDDRTIQEVLHLNRTVADYVACYESLKQHCSVIPHICIGLYGGEIRGEYRALEELQRLGADKITFIVFTPTKGTAFADKNPPALTEVEKIFAAARRLFPHIPLQLGCMRPGGAYRRELDCMAIQMGLNGIVNPAKDAVKLAEELGLQPERREECCVL